MSWVEDDHDWAQDPERAGEGLRCTACGVTEDEFEHTEVSCAPSVHAIHAEAERWEAMRGTDYDREIEAVVTDAKRALLLAETTQEILGDIYSGAESPRILEGNAYDAMSIAVDNLRKLASQ